MKTLEDTLTAFDGDYLSLIEYMLCPQNRYYRRCIIDNFVRDVLKVMFLL